MLPSFTLTQGSMAPHGAKDWKISPLFHISCSKREEERKAGSSGQNQQ